MREQYVWVPDSCSFESWNAKTFCTALGNRTVLIVGDSTLQQVAVTLINMIISDNGNCADKITFAKSYFLTFKKWGERKKHIFEFVEDINPDIVVFSAGAHLHDLGDLYSVMVICFCLECAVRCIFIYVLIVCIYVHIYTHIHTYIHTYIHSVY